MKSKQFHCKRCGYDFKSGIEGGPVACPKCKSYYWREKRQRDRGETGKEQKENDRLQQS